jgi:hypothetical protein
MTENDYALVDNAHVVKFHKNGRKIGVGIDIIDVYAYLTEPIRLMPETSSESSLWQLIFSGLMTAKSKNT